MKKSIRLFAAALSGAMLLSLGGCGSAETAATAEPTAAATAAESETVSAEVSAEASPAEDNAASDEIVRTYTTAESLPLTTDSVTLTAWDYVVPPVMTIISDYGTDGQVYAELQKRTGITLNFTTANLLNAGDSMALMVAANELPDIIFDFGMFYTGSMDDLVDGDILINYSDYKDQMPNYFDILDNNPDIARDVYTDEGYVVLADNIQQQLVPSSGPVIRQDWLDADGLETPTTIDELHDVLKTFQTENGCAYPLWVNSLGSCSLATAYGVSTSSNQSLAGWIYQDDTVQFCVPTDGYRDYIQLMADWYTEGLISPDFISQSYNNTATDDQITESGFFTTSVNGIPNLSGYVADSDVEPLSYLVLNEGDENHFDDAGSSRISKGGAAIACSNPDIALSCQLIDYFYSDDGILLSNYGVEGVSFEYDADGNPQLTDLVLNNPDGLNFSLALIKYTSSTPCSVVDNSRNFLGYTDAQTTALEVWRRTGESYQAPGSTYTADEQTELSTLLTDMDSYVDTQCLSFITGQTPMSQWDSFISELTSSFDIDRMQELQQNAVEAYLNKATSAS